MQTFYELNFRMNDLGKVLVAAGIVLVIVGAVLWKTGGLGPLGRLPGDITLV